MPVNIHSFSADPSFDTQIETLTELTRLSKSAAIRTAVGEAIDKRKIDTMTQNSSLVQKAEASVAAFFNKAVTQDTSHWGIVKAQAGDMLTNYSAAMNPTLSQPMAVAHMAQNPDEVTKALYRLAGMSGPDQFDAIKGQLAGAAGVL